MRIRIGRFSQKYRKRVEFRIRRVRRAWTVWLFAIAAIGVITNLPSAAIAAPGIVIIDNTAVGGAPAVLTNLRTGTAQDGACTAQQAVQGRCNSFARDNLQSMQRAGDGQIRLDIGVHNTQAASYSNAGTPNQLNYFARDEELFDLNKFRRAADTLATRAPTRMAPAGSYGTIDWRQFLTNIAQDQTMYGIVRVKIALVGIDPPGGVPPPPDDCKGRKKKHGDDEDESHGREAHEGEAHSSLKSMSMARSKDTGDKSAHEEDNDDDEHDKYGCRAGRDDDEDDHEDEGRNGDHANSLVRDQDYVAVLKSAMRKAQGFFSGESHDEEDESRHRKEKESEHRHRKYEMCGTPHPSRGEQEEAEHEDDDHAEKDDKRASNGLIARFKSTADRSERDDGEHAQGKDDEDEASHHEREYEERKRKVCACQPQRDVPLKRGQTYCGDIVISSQARIKVRGALIFDFVDENGVLIPKRSLPTPNELPIPMDIPLNINAGNDIDDDGTMDNLLNIASKSRAITCGSAAPPCSVPFTTQVRMEDIPWSVRENYALLHGTALTAHVLAQMKPADRYHLQMPSGYAQGWLDAFDALTITPSTWATLGFKVPANSPRYTLESVASAAFEDIPALMYQGGLVRLSDRLNISGMLYVPEVLVLSQRANNVAQYINGAVLVRDGFSIGTTDNGTALISHDRTVYDHLPLAKTSKVASIYVPPSAAANPSTPGGGSPGALIPRRGVEWVEVRARE